MHLREDVIEARLKYTEKGSNLNLCSLNLENIDAFNTYFQKERLDIVILSCNNIVTLRPLEGLNLKVLYVRSNKITDPNEFFYLRNMKKLVELGANENPATEMLKENYRPTLIKLLPALELLDSILIASFEREFSEKNGIILPMPLSAEGQRNRLIAQNTQLLKEISNVTKNSVQNSPTPNNAKLSNTNESPKVLKQEYWNNQEICKLEELVYDQRGESTKKENSIEINNNANTKSPMRTDILSAVLILLGDLDFNSLEVIHKEVQRRLNRN